MQDGSPRFLPHYDVISQVGLDVQLTLENTLVKMEAVRRGNGRDLNAARVDYLAYVAGIEQTLYGVGGSAADVHVFLEKSYDQRARHATSKSQDDLFLGIGLSLNDTQSTEFAVAWLKDMDFSSRLLSLKFNRRISNRWSVQARGSWVGRADPKDWIIHSVRQDSSVRVEWFYGF